MSYDLNNFLCGKDLMNFSSGNIVIRIIFLSENPPSDNFRVNFTNQIRNCDQSDLRIMLEDVYEKLTDPQLNNQNFSQADIDNSDLNAFLRAQGQNLIFAVSKLVYTHCNNANCNIRRLCNDNCNSRQSLILVVDDINNSDEQDQLLEPASLASAVSSQLETESFYSGDLNTSIMDLSLSDDERELVSAIRNYFNC